MKNILLSLMAVTLLALTTYAAAKTKSSKNPKLSVGDTAPNFILPNENNKPVEFHAVKGKKVLYFYPMDKTPGCTKQACSLRDGYKDLQAKGITVLGISYDSVESHAKFKQDKNLPFSLLSDVKKEVSKLYHTSGMFFTDRVTFLVDESNKIVKILKNISLKDHADQVTREFRI